MLERSIIPKQNFRAMKPRVMRPIDFGQQRRSYVLDRGVVIDHRTGKKTRHAQRVLNGELELVGVKFMRSDPLAPPPAMGEPPLGGSPGEPPRPQAVGEPPATQISHPIESRTYAHSPSSELRRRSRFLTQI